MDQRGSGGPGGGPGRGGVGGALHLPSGFYRATDNENSVKDNFWGPVEWVGDQLNGLGTS